MNLKEFRKIFKKMCFMKACIKKHAKLSATASTKLSKTFAKAFVYFKSFEELMLHKLQVIHLLLHSYNFNITSSPFSVCPFVES